MIWLTSHSKSKRRKRCHSQHHYHHTLTETPTFLERQKTLQIVTNKLFRLCLSELKGLTAAKHYNLDIFTYIIGWMWLWFFCTSHGRMPTGTQTQAALSPGAEDCLTVARIRCLHRSRLHLSARSTQHRPAALVYLSTASDSLAEDHISVILFLCSGEESSAVFIYASLSRDETGEWTSDLKIYGAFLLRTALKSLKLFLPPTYLPFHRLPTPHAPPLNAPSVSCRIYLAVPQQYRNRSSYTNPSSHFLLITANVASSSSLAAIQLI